MEKKLVSWFFPPVIAVFDEVHEVVGVWSWQFTMSITELQNWAEPYLSAPCSLHGLGSATLCLCFVVVDYICDVPVLADVLLCLSYPPMHLEVKKNCAF
jgi:hypothetical protein